MARRGHFFITGFPRSRTAWLANLFTYGNSWCWHEATNHFRPEDYMGELSECNFDYVGDSNCSLYSLAPKLNLEFPEARWLIIDRERQEAQASFVRHFTRNPDPRYTVDATQSGFDEIETGLRHLAELSAKNLMLVKFDDVDRRIREIWKWLVPHEPFNGDRYEMLSALKINQIPQRIPAWA